MRPVSSEIVYKGRIFDLKKETFMVDKHLITREIIHHPGSALMVPLIDAGKRSIIMIKQYRHAAGEEIIEFPAGTRDKGETFKACASRELVEETGYKAASVKKLTGFYLAPGTMTELMEIYLCRGLVKHEQELEIDEKIMPFITTLDKAVKMIFSGRIVDAKTICGVLMLKNIFDDRKLSKKYLGRL
jgi:ADP-ribose pyrophosphatase